MRTRKTHDRSNTRTYSKTLRSVNIEKFLWRNGRFRRRRFGSPRGKYGERVAVRVRSFPTPSVHIIERRPRNDAHRRQHAILSQTRFPDTLRRSASNISVCVIEMRKSKQILIDIIQQRRASTGRNTLKSYFSGQDIARKEEKFDTGALCYT